MVLSVIIPVYNCEMFLEQAVLSILKQPSKDVEIIIVDDGSTDDSPLIADRLSNEHQNIKVFHIPNGGVSHARNFGIKKATGKFIAFLDSDDVWCKDVYTDEFSSLLKKQSNVAIYSFGYIVCDGDLQKGNFIKAKNYEPKTGSHYDNFYFKSFCSNIYPKEVFNDVFFDERHRYGEDMEFLIKIMCKEISIISMQAYLFMYRQNLASVMHTQNRTNSDYLLIQLVTFGDLYFFVKEHNYDNQMIDICKFVLMNIALNYIEEATIKGKSKEKIVEALSKYIDISFIQTELPWKSDHLAFIQTEFFNNYREYKKTTIKRNMKRYVACKLKLNQIEWLRVKLLAQKYNHDVLHYSY